jgi:4'-phosphopantetheinyl transferase
MNELSDDVVDLWVTPVPSSGFEAILPRIAGRLTPDEIEAAHRFVFERHRVLYAVSHTFVRSVLKQYLGRDEIDIDIVRTDRGRPELRDRSLRFSLSHTEGVALVGVTRSGDIGVDVERIDRSVRDLTRAVFTPEELDLWDGEPETFFRRWTLKEAYAKARGLGLSLGLQDFGFDLTEPPLLRCDSAFDDPEGWHFYSFRPLSGFRAAGAVRRRDRITWRNLPTQSVEILPPGDLLTLNL